MARIVKELSNTKIKERSRKKTNPELRETILAGKNNPAWLQISRLLSTPSRKRLSKNLFEIDKETKAGDTVVIPGKVLSKGSLSKKLRIVALSFSEKVKEKVKANKTELITILDEIKKNKKAEGVKILK